MALDRNSSEYRAWRELREEFVEESRAIELRVDVLNARINGLAEQADKIESILADVQRTVRALDDKVDKLRGEVGEVSGEVNDVSDAVDDVALDVESMATMGDLDEVQKSVDILRAQIQEAGIVLPNLSKTETVVETVQVLPSETEQSEPDESIVARLREALS